MKIKEQFNENEGLEQAEYDRDIRIAEQKRFDRSLGFSTIIGMRNQETLVRDEPVRILQSNPFR